MCATDNPLARAAQRLELERAGLLTGSQPCQLCADLADRLEQTMDALSDALIRQEDAHQQLGEAHNEITYWRGRATQAEMRLPDRLHIVGPDGIA